MEENTEKSSGYGKRPIWQWILIYLVIGGIIYGIIYYFVFASKGGYSTGSNYGSTPQQQNTSPNYP